MKKSKRMSKRRVKKSKRMPKRVSKSRVKKSKRMTKRVSKRRVKKSKRMTKRVSKSRVKNSKRIPNRQAKSRRSGLKGIKLNKGELEGYKLSDPVVARRRTLGIQVYKKGYLPVMKRVNVISVLLRNKSPNLSKNAESDKNWLMKRQKQGGVESRWIPNREDGTGFFR